MANHKVADQDRRTVLVGYKANEVDVAVLKAAQEQSGLSTQAEVIRQAVRQQYSDLYAKQKAARSSAGQSRARNRQK